MALAQGTIHKLTENISTRIKNESVDELWNDLTPLARNEFICWVTSAKKEETQAKRLDRMIEELKDGKRRPCCWPGCPHHRESAKKWFK